MIDEAAKATRRHHVECEAFGNNVSRSAACFVVGPDKLAASERFTGPDASWLAQVACDRLNLRAVLEALREPDMGACARAFVENQDENPGGTWRAMIDHLLWQTGGDDA